MKKYFIQLLKGKSGNEERSFYHIIFLSFLTVSVLSTFLLTFFLTMTFFNFISLNMKHYNEKLLAQTNYTIDQQKENVDWISSSLLTNNRVVASLSLSTSEGTRIPLLASKEINKLLTALPSVDSIYLYNAELDQIFSSKSGYQQTLSSFPDQSVVSHLQDSDFVANDSGAPIVSDDFFTYYIFDNYAPDTQKRDAIIINIPSSVLPNSIDTMKDLSTDKDSSFLLLDSDMSYLTGLTADGNTPDDTFKKAAIKLLSKKKNFDSSYVRINNTTYFLTHTNQNVYQWNLFNLIPATAIFQHLIIIVLLSLFFWIGVLIFTVRVCKRFAEYINEPVEELTVHLKENKSAKKTASVFTPKEFKMISSTVSSLQKNNKQLRLLQQRSHYSLRQTYLNNLIINPPSEFPDDTNQNLDYFHLQYLKDQKLCMVILKIDNYPVFLSGHTPDELWNIQFSVVNIVEELASEKFICSAFSRSDDKFVLLVSCEPEMALTDFENGLIELLQSIQNNIERYLHFTMTATYSTLFHGMEKLPIIYQNTQQSLLLKMRFGHHAIITPSQIDDVLEDTFQLSPNIMIHLIDNLSKGQFDACLSEYEKLTDNLFSYDYDEIIAAMIYFIHSIYEQLLIKYPMLKDIFTESMKLFITDLHKAEVSEDIKNLVKDFFHTTCLAIQEFKQNSAQQNTQQLVEKITQIIDERYSDSSLCIATIASELDFSINYTRNIFKQYMQKSVAQYLFEVRMEKVGYYLRTTSLPINTILEKVGMEMSNYFYTKFKKFFGMSLTDYRQQLQNIEK